MKRSSQLIVLLDVMFIFLFILIIKPDRDHFNIIIDNNINIPFTKVIAIKNNTIFFLENNRWIQKKFTTDDIAQNIAQINLIKNSESRGKYFTIKRPSIVNKLPAIPKDAEVYTLIYGKLYNDIVSYGFIECTFSNKCNQYTTINITSTGKVQFK